MPKISTILLIIVGIIVGLFVIIAVLAITIPLLLLSSKSNNATSTTEYNSTNENFTNLLNLNEGCGITDINPNARIVGGIEAIPHSWPYHVLILQTYKTDYTIGGRTVRITQQFLCGGTIISDQTILTAAHCINTGPFSYIDNTGRIYQIPMVLNQYYPTMESMFKVYTGLQNSDHSSLKNADELPVRNIIVNKNFSGYALQNDICLLILNKKISFNSKVRPACLPSKVSNNFPPSNQNVIAVGWGAIVEGGYASNVLNNILLNVYDPSYCKNVLPFVDKNWNSQLCVGYYNGGKDTCQGDSGGGIYFTETLSNGQTKYVLVGITSYGEGCAEYGKPGIYTRTSYYLDWIKTNWV